MQIIQIPPRGFGANTYVLTEDNENAIVIDPASPRVESELIRLGLKACYVLLTHCHFDHTVGVPALQDMGATVICTSQEKPFVGTPHALSALFGAPEPEYCIDQTFEDFEEKELCGLLVKCLLTAGHTKGSCVYLIADPNTGERALFTGDTLFENSIGRTDFPSGNVGEILKSLRFLTTLDESLSVYAGHGEDTTIGNEKRFNPFLKDL